MAHRLGFAVKVLGGGGLPSHDTRRWQSEPHLRVSLERLAAIFDYLAEIDVRMYRMTSDLVPYGTHPDLPQFHDQIAECAEELAELGRRATAADLRLSTHPGQYIVLNSEKPEVRESAVRDRPSSRWTAMGYHRRNTSANAMAGSARKLVSVIARTVETYRCSSRSPK